MKHVKLFEQWDYNTKGELENPRHFSINENKIKEQYRNIFFSQGEDADSFIDILDSKGAKYLINYLDSSGIFDSQDDSKVSEQPPYGSGDHLYRVKVSGDKYVISVNYNIPYIGITHVM